jgi:hypothetical protein
MGVVKAEVVPRVSMMHIMVLYVVDYTRQPSSLDATLPKHKIARQAEDLLMCREDKRTQAGDALRKKT